MVVIPEGRSAVPQQVIANGIAQIYKDVYGRGPTKVVAYVHPDVVFVVLGEINTPGQNHLIAIDEVGLLNTVHSRIQRSVQAQLIAVIETTLDRKVKSYVPGFNGPADCATDTFLLKPQ